MALDSREIEFLDSSGCELRLQVASKTARSCKYGDTSRVGVEAMNRPQLLRVIHLVQDKLQRVAVESAGRMERQRSWLIDDDNRIIFVQHANRRVDIRLRCCRHSMQIPLA